MFFETKRSVLAKMIGEVDYRLNGCLVVCTKDYTSDCGRVWGGVDLVDDICDVVGTRDEGNHFCVVVGSTTAEVVVAFLDDLVFVEEDKTRTCSAVPMLFWAPSRTVCVDDNGVGVRVESCEGGEEAGDVFLTLLTVLG